MTQQSARAYDLGPDLCLFRVDSEVVSRPANGGSVKSDISEHQVPHLDYSVVNGKTGTDP